MSEYEHERKNDIIVARLSQRFDDFLLRYDENQNEAKAWRFGFSDRLQKVEDFVNDFSPVHKKIMAFLMIVVSGSIGYWLKLFWDNLRK